MNEPAPHQERRPSARRRWLLLLVSLPIVLGVIAVAILGLGEYRCALRGGGGNRPPAGRGRTRG